MSRASGSDRASRSSLVTTRVSPNGRQSFAQAGAAAVGTGEAMVDVDVLLIDAECDQGVALRGEVLLVGRSSGVSDLHVVMSQ